MIYEVIDGVLIQTRDIDGTTQFRTINKVTGETTEWKNLFENLRYSFFDELRDFLNNPSKG